MSKSSEDYIKIIYILKNEKESVRSIDVARALGFSRASVSNAMAGLRESGMIVMDKKGEIIFTDEGEKIAASIYEKHATLSRFLKKVAGVDDETAGKDACKIEHIISPETYEGIRRFTDETR